MMDRIGAEIGADGLPHGRDPRRMTQAELQQMGHEPMPVLAALRAHCLDCCAGSPDEVRKCMALKCPSWPFRMGSNPWRAPVTEARREAARVLAAKNATIKAPAHEWIVLPAREWAEGYCAIASAMLARVRRS